MAKGGPVTDDEEEAILKALGSGKSTHKVAKEFKRAQSTISDVARRNGLDLADRSAIKKAAIAKSCYASVDRIKLIGAGLNKARDLLPGIDNPKDLKDWFLGVAIAIDKRRLEDEDIGEGKGGELTTLFNMMEAES